MVGEEADARGLAERRPEETLAWWAQGGRERADTDEVQAAHDVLAVEKQDPEVFAIQVRDQRRHQVGYVLALAHLTVPRRGDAAVLHHEQPIAGHSIGHRRVSTSDLSGEGFAHEACRSAKTPSRAART